MAAIRVRPAAKAAEKFVARAQLAAPDYTEGIRSPSRPQSESAIAAFPNYQAAVTESFGRGAYVKGLRDSGEEKWRRNAETKGAQRYAPGVAAAKADYQQSYSVLQSALDGFDPGARGPKGSPQNQAISAAVNTRLRAAKVGGGG